MTTTDGEAGQPPPIPGEEATKREARSLAPLPDWLRDLAQCASQLGSMLSPALARLTPLLESLRPLAARMQTAVEAWQRALDSPQARELFQGLVALAEVTKAAPAYCAPYNQQIAELGLTPLSEGEERDFAVMAALIGREDEFGTGRRVPLVQVALAGKRSDIALALMLQRGLGQTAIRSVQVADADRRDDLDGEAVVALGEEILPDFERRLKEIRLSEARARLGPLLRDVTKDAYLVTAIRRELVRYLVKEQQRAGREHLAEPAEIAVRVEALSIDALQVKKLISRFAHRGGAKPIDAQLVAALCEDPTRSMASLARELGVAERTLRHRRRLLREFISEHLVE